MLDSLHINIDEGRRKKQFDFRTFSNSGPRLSGTLSTDYDKVYFLSSLSHTPESSFCSQYSAKLLH